MERRTKNVMNRRYLRFIMTLLPPKKFDIFIAKSEKALPPLEWDVSE